MAAGDSAGVEARRQLALADAHAAAALEARATAARYGLADVTEKRTARALAPLAAVGHHLLADRRWPGSRRAQVDLVVVGPGGVFVVDTKAWKDVRIESDRLYRGQEDVTDDVLGLADLVHTAEGDFAEIGLAPGEVHAVVVLAGRSGVDERVGPVRVVGEKDVLRLIASRGQRLTAGQVDAVLARALALFPEVNSPAPVNTVIPEPVLPADEDPADGAPVHQPAEQPALLSEEEVRSALLMGMLTSPIEEWMSFLHPDQAKLVRRSFNGPARIRGAAGTGKTVVALHRAAYLARTRPGRVLVATFVRTLPDVLRQMLGRMAPDAVGQVDFTGIHGFALDLLDRRGVTVRLDARRSDEAFDRAWERVGSAGRLGGTARESRYWRDEIRYVIKGRGITEFRQYAELARTGRGYRLTPDQRHAVWELYRAYYAELRALGVCDFEDVILLAEAELHRQPLDEPYSAVIVDEAQDLSCAMVRMLHATAADSPDAFTLVGDGQQTIYPGGYTLAEAGISLAGRGAVLDVNYRNTAQILAFAQRVVAGDEYADIEGVTSRGDVPATVARSGPEPVIEQCVSTGERSRRLVERVREVLRAVGTGPGDVGVLCLTRYGVRNAVAALRGAGVPVVSLEDYDGRPVDAVKVGTIKRAKGLEFKQVLLADVRADYLGDTTPPDDGAERERWELRRRELYVGMTRARDGLWVGVTP